MKIIFLFSGIKKRGVAVVGRGSNSATDEGTVYTLEK